MAVAWHGGGPPALGAIFLRGCDQAPSQQVLSWEHGSGMQRSCRDSFLMRQPNSASCSSTPGSSLPRGQKETVVCEEAARWWRWLMLCHWVWGLKRMENSRKNENISHTSHSENWDRISKIWGEGKIKNSIVYIGLFLARRIFKAIHNPVPIRFLAALIDLTLFFVMARMLINTAEIQSGLLALLQEFGSNSLIFK